MTDYVSPVETLIDSLREIAADEHTALYSIMWRNAGVGVQWHEESRCTTAEYHGSDMQIAAAAAGSRTKEGLVVYGYHDDLRTALACELIRFTVKRAEGDNDDDRRTAAQAAVWPETPGWIGRDASFFHIRRCCIACLQHVVPAEQHSDARELNFWMTTLCDTCQNKIGL